MIANILSFPTPLERDQIEFDRTDASNFTRALDEAYNLWWALQAAGDHRGYAPRIEALAGAIERLASYRAEDLDDMVILGSGTRISLRLMPGVLMAIVELGVEQRRHAAANA